MSEHWPELALMWVVFTLLFKLIADKPPKAD